MDYGPRSRSRDVLLSQKSWIATDYSYMGTCTQPTYMNNKGTVYTGTIEVHNIETMDDVVTEHFERRSKQGHIINSPMSKVSTVIVDELCTYSYAEVYGLRTNCSGVYKDLYRGGGQYGTIPASNYLKMGLSSPPLLPVPPFVQPIDQAVTQAWANAELSQAAILASLAEGKETVYSMISIMGRLVKIIKDMATFNVKSLLRQLKPKEIADRYMEFRYALRPLFYDTLQVIDAATMSAVPQRMTFRGHKKCSETLQQTGTYANSVNRSFNWQKTSVRSVDVRAGVLCEVEELSKLNVWGCYSIAETVWELIPFSFIIDWFFNVGQTIASWTPNSGLKTLASWYTVLETHYQEIRVVSTSAHNRDGKTYFDLHFQLGNCVYSKSAISKVRVPNPNRFVLPTFQLNLDTAKLIDLMIIGKKILARTM